MYYTDDAERDFARWDMEQERRRERRPKCSICGEHIQDEEGYLINDEFVCQKCLDRDYKVRIEDYIDK